MPQNQIIIRRLNINDLSKYKLIRLEAVKLEPTAFGGSYEDEVLLPDSFYENQLSKVWATADSGVFGAFASNGELIGTIGLFKRGGRKLSHKAVLWGMYVKSSYRKSGVGRQLVQEVIVFGKSMKAEFVDLTVVSENESAIHLYKSLGFKIWGTEPAALKYNQKNFDELHMTLKIAD